MKGRIIKNISLTEPENTDGRWTVLSGCSILQQRRSGDFDYVPVTLGCAFILEASLREFTDMSASGTENPGVKTMDATGHFWDAAEITWPDGQITTRDLYWLEIPN